MSHIRKEIQEDRICNMRRNRLESDDDNCGGDAVLINYILLVYTNNNIKINELQVNGTYSKTAKEMYIEILFYKAYS